MNLLIVEDEEELARFTENFFLKKGWNCSVVSSKHDVLDFMKKSGADLDIILLDLMLDQEKGEDILKTIRKTHKQVPIIVTTAVGQLSKKIELFNLGADDYLVKPFEIEELEVRIESLRKKYKKIEKIQKSVIEIDSEYVFDFVARSIGKKGNKVDVVQLTKKEAELFKILLDSKGAVVDNDQIIKSVWDSKPGYQSNVITATLKRLKEKLKPVGFDKKIITIKSIGIKFLDV